MEDSTEVVGAAVSGEKFEKQTKTWVRLLCKCQTPVKPNSIVIRIFFKGGRSKGIHNIIIRIGKTQELIYYLLHYALHLYMVGSKGGGSRPGDPSPLVCATETHSSGIEFFRKGG